MIPRKTQVFQATRAFVSEGCMSRKFLDARKIRKSAGESGLQIEATEAAADA